ncbi:hypothetical protein HYV11_00245 [Candidatus Dependentiae bacterium]|nr:hypothetical protein [Candidatus Dependentiae bacterium]
MKKLMLISLSTLLFQSTFPRGGSGFGGVATGALLGAGVTLAATSGSRSGRDYSHEYYESKRDAHARSEIKFQIRDEEREIKKLKNKKRKLEKTLNKLEEKGKDNDTIKKNSEDIKNIVDEIKEHEEFIKDLKADLRAI